MTYDIDAFMRGDWPDACIHKPADAEKLSYLAWHAYAAAATKAGHRQVFCQTCQYWRWRLTACPERATLRLEDRP